MSSFIKKYIDKGVFYTTYREAVGQMAVEGSTSGNNKTEALINYTKLNDRRMKRWDKTLKIPSDLIERIKSFNSKTTWLVITESWCGDAAHLIPVFNKIASLNDNITLKIVYRDENEELMDRFLTNGSRSIAKLIITDANDEVVTTYGPRPNTLTKMVDDFKKEHGKLTDEFKQELQVWYNKDKGLTTMDELVNILCQVEPAICLETKM
jgi:thiol-disulfide isomerase/thioredoxin